MEKQISSLGPISQLSPHKRPKFLLSSSMCLLLYCVYVGEGGGGQKLSGEGIKIFLLIRILLSQSNFLNSP